MNNKFSIRLSSLFTLFVFFSNATHSFGEEESSRLDPSRSSEHQKKTLEYSKKIEECPNDVWPYLSRASLLWRTGNRERAAHDLSAARKLDPYLADATEGFLLYLSGEKQKSDKILTAAIDAEPRRFDAYYFRAKLRLDQKDPYGSLDDLDKALAFSPPRSLEACDCSLTRGSIYHELGKFQEAINAATEAINRQLEIDADLARLGIECGSGNPRHYYLRGTAYMKLSRFQEAISDYNVCESIGVNWPELFRQRAECFHAVNDIDRENADRKRFSELQSSTAQQKDRQ